MTPKKTVAPTEPTADSTPDQLEEYYRKRRAEEETQYEADRDKRTKEREAKEAEEKSKTDERNARLAKSQTAKFSVLQTNGKPLHLCEDGVWRTDEDLSKIGQED